MRFPLTALYVGLLPGCRAAPPQRRRASAHPSSGLVRRRTFLALTAAGSFIPARTGFSVCVTTKVFLPPEPVPNESGVRPDFVVASTRADRRAGRDPVLEAVLKRLT
jgi:hypothetical protein